MADEKTTTFRHSRLARLRSFNCAALDGKLDCATKHLNEGNHGIVVLDDLACPPVQTVPARSQWAKPEQMQQACEYCLAVATEGGRFQMCGRCKTARYCNAERESADWERQKDPDCINYSHDHGRDIPLQQACVVGNVAEVRRLVEEEGANVNNATTNGPTPLSAAATWGRLSVVRYLVEQGADVDKARATCFTPLYGAAFNGFLMIVRYLVQQGADVNHARATFYTPLYGAAIQGFLPVVQYLVEKGADKDAASAQGATALLAAAQEGHLAIVQYLVEQGTEKDKARGDGATPLFAAAFKGHLEVVRYLAQHGADKAMANNDGLTPLQAALSEGHREVAAFLRATEAR